MKNKYRNQIKSLNAARNQYNPLRGITLQHVVSSRRVNVANIIAAVAIPHTRKTRCRCSRLETSPFVSSSKLEWQIKTIPADQLPNGFTEKQAEAQAQAAATLRKARYLRRN